jgi:hypothetical protein
MEGGSKGRQGWRKERGQAIGLKMGPALLEEEKDEQEVKNSQKDAK